MKISNQPRRPKPKIMTGPSAGQVSVKLSAKTLTQIKTVAQENNATCSQVVREILEQWYGEKRHEA